MKKGLTLLAAVAIAVTFSSCKKEYDCNCISPSGETVETHKGKDATDACNDGTKILQLKTCTPV